MAVLMAGLSMGTRKEGRERGGGVGVWLEVGVIQAWDIEFMYTVVCKVKGVQIHNGRGWV